MHSLLQRIRINIFDECVSRQAVAGDAAGPRVPAGAPAGLGVVDVANVAVLRRRRRAGERAGAAPAAVDKRKARVVAHVLAVASHVLRTRPEHVAVVDDMLRPDVDLLRLLKHRNPLITARCCTLIAHLTHRSASDADVCAKSLAIQRCRIDSK